MASDNDNAAKENSQEIVSSFARWAIAVGVVWFILGFALYALNFHTYPISSEGKDWGDFGVFIAGFSGTGVAVITLVAVAYGIRVQAEDLAKSRAFMAEQSKTMAQQAFDSVFFSLLERFSAVRDSVSIVLKRETFGTGLSVRTYEDYTLTGRRAFQEFYEQMTRLYLNLHHSDKDRLVFVRNIFINHYQTIESELGPYFRTLYRIYKFVDRANLTEIEKREYANIARAQLSAIELCVLFYDGLTELAVNFKPLIEKYGVLKHVNCLDLMMPEDKDDRTLYAARAFELSHGN